jgi:hypothetical protein
MVFVVRTDGGSLSLVDPVRRIVRGLDSAQPVAQVRTMEAIVAKTFSRSGRASAHEEY